MGVDGNGYAPFAHRADLLDFVRLNAGLDGDPRLEYDWDTVASYLDRYDRGQAINVGIVVGNSALRIGAIGWEDEPAEERAVAAMRSMLREAMQEGAFGVSSGLDYPPGSYASTDELAALTREAAEHGGFYHTHVRYPLGDRFLDPFREAIEIGRRGEGPAHITHFYHRQTFPGSADDMLALVDDARAAGQDVTFDAYPYEWAARARLLVQLPQWVQAGGPTRLKERLADSAMRDRIRSQMAARGAAYASAAGWADVRLGAFSRADNLRWEGRTLAEVMEETGRDPVDAICELLLSEDLGVAQVTTGPWTDGLRRFLPHPAAMVGTDSTFLGASRHRAPTAASHGSWASSCGTRRCCRWRRPSRMTGAPAARLGLRERGLLTDGFAADVVVFDAARVRALATYDEPRRFPDGIEHVIVNGDVVVDGGPPYRRDSGSRAAPRTNMILPGGHLLEISEPVAPRPSGPHGRAAMHRWIVRGGTRTLPPDAGTATAGSDAARARHGSQGAASRGGSRRAAPPRGPGQADRRGQVRRRPRLPGAWYGVDRPLHRGRMPVCWGSTSRTMTSTGSRVVSSPPTTSPARTSSA